MKIKSLSVIAMSALMLTSVIDTAASAATTSTTTKAPYIIAKSTVDKVKAGTYATKIFICLNPKKL